MRYLLDANAVIGLLNDKDSRIAQRARLHKPSDVGISAIVAYELFYGAFKSQRPALRLILGGRTPKPNVEPATIAEPGDGGPERVPSDHPLRSAYCDRAFDDDGRVIFAHLGRGTLKAAGQYAREGKTDAAAWLALGRRLLGSA